MANNYALQVGKFVSTLGPKGDVFTQKLLLDMFTSIVRRSPVRSGRFRNNWNASIGAPNYSTDRQPDKVGTKSLEDAKNVAMKARVGNVYFFTNGLPYARRLETGWSKQAPAGMVGITVAEFQVKVDKVAKELNRA